MLFRSLNEQDDDLSGEWEIPRLGVCEGAGRAEECSEQKPDCGCMQVTSCRACKLHCSISYGVYFQ